MLSEFQSKHVPKAGLGHSHSELEILLDDGSIETEKENLVQLDAEVALSSGVPVQISSGIRAHKIRKSEHLAGDVADISDKS